MDNYRKTFISPTVAISFVHTDITKSWSAAYRLHNFAPNIVQLRPQIDNSNPYMLRSGNPNLKQSYLHSFLFNCNRMLGKHKPHHRCYYQCLYPPTLSCCKDNLITNAETYLSGIAIHSTCTQFSN